jgi:uncharacterized protein
MAGWSVPWRPICSPSRSDSFASRKLDTTGRDGRMLVVTMTASGRRRPSRVRTVFRSLLFVIVVALLAAHAVGGWLFSSWVGESALVPPTPDRVADGAVLDLSGDRVTIRPFDNADDALDAPGVVGFDFGQGFLRLGEVISISSGDVTRTFELVEGSEPPLGASGFIDPNPADVDTMKSGLGIVEAGYDSPLGRMDAWIADGSDTWMIHVHDRNHGLEQALRTVRALAPEGFTHMAINYRGDPGQPSDSSGLGTYGLTERDDLAAAIEFALDRGATRIFLAGYGSGGAVVLAEAYRSSDVAGIVLDGPIVDARSAIEHRAGSEEGLVGRLPATVRAVGMFVASLRFSISWETTDYLSRAELLDEPTLVLHGSEDLDHPVDDSRRLAAERPGVVTLVEIPGAGSDRTWNLDPGTYETALLAFLDHVRAGG